MRYYHFPKLTNPPSTHCDEISPAEYFAWVERARKADAGMDDAWLIAHEGESVSMLLMDADAVTD